MNPLSEEDRRRRPARGAAEGAGAVRRDRAPPHPPRRHRSRLGQEIHALAAERFGVEAHWHKRVVRTGSNTLKPYSEDPPDLTIRGDDILFVDLGPVFQAWEADFGRTYVLGDDPAKLRLRDDLEPVFRRAKAQFPHASGHHRRRALRGRLRPCGGGGLGVRRHDRRASRRRIPARAHPGRQEDALYHARQRGAPRHARQGRAEAPLDPGDPSRRPRPRDRRVLRGAADGRLRRRLKPTSVWTDIFQATYRWAPALPPVTKRRLPRTGLVEHVRPGESAS